jgi:CheY-like chemotaxis protein
MNQGETMFMASIKRILLVDDETVSANLLSRALLKVGFSECQVVANGESAVEAVSASRPDLVIMDVHLKGSLGGIDAAEIISTQYSVPVVFMTGYDLNDVKSKTRHLNPAGYIAKPVKVETLVALLNSI